MQRQLPALSWLYLWLSRHIRGRALTSCPLLVCPVPHDLRRPRELSSCQLGGSGEVGALWGWLGLQGESPMSSEMQASRGLEQNRQRVAGPYTAPRQAFHAQCHPLLEGQGAPGLPHCHDAVLSLAPEHLGASNPQIPMRQPHHVCNICQVQVSDGADSRRELDSSQSSQNPLHNLNREFRQIAQCQGRAE